MVKAQSLLVAAFAISTATAFAPHQTPRTVRELFDRDLWNIGTKKERDSEVSDADS